MAEMLVDTTVRRLFEAASSERPTPGGGAVTALTGILGISLILKALRISARKLSDPASIAGVEAALNAASARLMSCADEDSLSFQAYIDASRLPRDSEAQKAERARALGGAAIRAAGAALATLEAGVQGLDLANQAEPMIAKNIAEDLLAGRQLLHVTCEVAVVNTEANLASIKDEGEKRRAESRLAVARAAVRGVRL